MTITGIAATTSSGVLGFIVRQIVSKDGSLVNRNVAEAERRLTEALNATTHALNKATANEARLIEIYERRLGQETQ